MTDQSLYLKALSIVCGCSPDEEGNMPCDNGMWCNDCMQYGVAEQIKVTMQQIKDGEIK